MVIEVCQVQSHRAQFSISPCVIVDSTLFDSRVSYAGCCRQNPNPGSRIPPRSGNRLVDSGDLPTWIKSPARQVAKSPRRRARLRLDRARRAAFGLLRDPPRPPLLTRPFAPAWNVLNGTTSSRRVVEQESRDPIAHWVIGFVVEGLEV